MTAEILAKDFDFYLPEELIAQTPLLNRSASKLLTVNVSNKTYEDKQFKNIIDHLKVGDVLVLNNTKVLPARLHGIKEETNAHIELLLLNNIENDDWEVLAKPAKRVKVGNTISFGDGRLKAVVLSEQEQGGRRIRFMYEGIFLEVLNALGEMPLPPYIKEKLQDQDRYQTVYAKEVGSAAAPTAGLHFTPELLEEIKSRGIEIAYVTLHVGLGTFRPVSVDNILEHTMHAEYYFISEDSANVIEKARQEHRRIVAVGTTTIRTLETIANLHDNKIVKTSGWSSIFIYPGYTFKVVDAFVTNFHLPKSTLLMLVSAFTGREFILSAYEHAVKEKYRFFSFGDAMFIEK